MYIFIFLLYLYYHLWWIKLCVWFRLSVLCHEMVSDQDDARYLGGSWALVSAIYVYRAYSIRVYILWMLERILALCLMVTGSFSICSNNSGSAISQDDNVRLSLLIIMIFSFDRRQWLISVRCQHDSKHSSEVGFYSVLATVQHQVIFYRCCMLFVRLNARFVFFTHNFTLNVLPTSYVNSTWGFPKFP